MSIIKLPSQEQTITRWGRRRLANLPVSITPRPTQSSVSASEQSFMLRQIGIQNLSTQVSDTQVQDALHACQIQLNRDWSPVWHTSAQLTFYSQNEQIPHNSWKIWIADSSDLSGALGYHGEDVLSVPYSRVFVQDALRYGFAWSVTLSHEILEMMGNPWVNLSVLKHADQYPLLLYAYETCDAVQSDVYGYMIDNVWVSNFQYPAWFDHTPREGEKLDHMAHCGHSFQILPGGYMPVFEVRSGSGWQSLNHDQMLSDRHIQHYRNNHIKCLNALGHMPNIFIL